MSDTENSCQSDIISTTPTTKPFLPPTLSITDSHLITVGAKDGFLFVRGSGFLAQATVPAELTGAGWFHTSTAFTLRPTQDVEGGTFTVMLGADCGLALQLNSRSASAWTTQSVRGMEIGLDGTWTGTWRAQN